jgi:hypothetical protein
MYAFRDTLLHPLPKGPADITKLDGTTHAQQDVRECIARGEIENLRIGAFSSLTWIISERYCSLGDGVDSLEGYLHSIWYIYYQLSRLAPYETADQDRLVLDIVRIQGLGPLTRPVSGNFGIDIARTVQGTLWNDLPFLATDMTDFWIHNCASMSSTHRLNFASFLAKLASTRVTNDQVCQIALILFRSTLEEAQALHTLSEEKQDKEDLKREIHDLAIADLLPATCAWIKEAGHNLIQLSDVFWDNCPRAVSQGGRNFVESELGIRSPTGFTPWRWMYWLKRLHEIRDEAHAAHEEHMEELAADAIERMINTVKERNSGILRAYQKAGPHQDPHLVCLAAEVPENQEG